MHRLSRSLYKSLAYVEFCSIRFNVHNQDVFNRGDQGLKAEEKIERIKRLKRFVLN